MSAVDLPVTTWAATLAAVSAAAAAWLLVPGPGRASARSPRRRRAVTGALPVAAALVALALAGPRVALLAAVGVGAVAGGRALLARRRRRARRAETARQVLEACEQVAAELAAGQPPAAALTRAAQAWPGLAAVAEAHQLGADVPAALRIAAREPGAEDLRVVAAAWHVAHRSGRGLAGAVERVVLRLRSQRQTRRVVESELASARSTARLVAGLPVLALAMGSGTGGDPWRFLVSSPVGLACLAAGLALGLAGLWWIEAIADGVERP